MASSNWWSYGSDSFIMFDQKNLNIYFLDKSYLIKKSLNLKNLYNFFLFRNIQIYFLKNKNKIYMQEQNLLICLFLVNSYFFRFFSVKIENLNFLFLNFKKFFSFFLNFFNIYNKISSLFFFRLKLKGLGFVLKRYSKYLFSFLMAVNHYYYFFVPNFFLLKKKKKHIICLSINQVNLNVLFWHLLFIKKHNVYVRTKKLNGFIKTNFIRFIRKKYKL